MRPPHEAGGRDALTGDRVSVSATPYVPRVEIYADLDQDGKVDMMMGDNVKPSGKPVTLRVQLTGNTVAGATYTVNVVKDGNKFGTFQGIGGKTTMVEFTDTPENSCPNLLLRHRRGTPHRISAGF